MATNEPATAVIPHAEVEPATPPAAPEPAERIYFPELDGLRFIAFMMVYLFHGGVPQGVVAWDVEVTNQTGETVAAYTILTLVRRRQG